VRGREGREWKGRENERGEGRYEEWEGKWKDESPL